MNATSLRDDRYDGVFHLVTAAIGAEEHYTLENNMARSEPPELAKDVDARTQNAWVGHPRHMLFDNSTDFPRKIERVIAASSRIVGLPGGPLESAPEFFM
ncbi:unnamed protein product, partial [Discosporangium mesarthrocarpum]